MYSDSWSQHQLCKGVFLFVVSDRKIQAVKLHTLGGSAAGSCYIMQARTCLENNGKRREGESGRYATNRDLSADYKEGRPGLVSTMWPPPRSALLSFSYCTLNCPLFPSTPPLSSPPTSPHFLTLSMLERMHTVIFSFTYLNHDMGLVFLVQLPETAFKI